MFSINLARKDLGLDTRCGPLVCPHIIYAQKVLLGFSNRNFSVVARSLEIGGVILPCLEKHVKPLVVRLISLRSCRIAVPSDYKSKGTESAPAHATKPILDTCFAPTRSIV